MSLLLSRPSFRRLGCRPLIVHPRRDRCRARGLARQAQLCAPDDNVPFGGEPKHQDIARTSPYSHRDRAQRSREGSAPSLASVTGPYRLENVRRWRQPTPRRRTRSSGTADSPPRIRSSSMVANNHARCEAEPSLSGSANVHPAMNPDICTPPSREPPGSSLAMPGRPSCSFGSRSHSHFWPSEQSSTRRLTIWWHVGASRSWSRATAESVAPGPGRCARVLGGFDEGMPALLCNQQVSS